MIFLTVRTLYCCLIFSSLVLTNINPMRAAMPQVKMGARAGQYEVATGYNSSGGRTQYHSLSPCHVPTVPIRYGPFLQAPEYRRQLTPMEKLAFRISDKYCEYQNSYPARILDRVFDNQKVGNLGMWSFSHGQGITFTCGVLVLATLFAALYFTEFFRFYWPSWPFFLRCRYWLPRKKTSSMSLKINNQTSVYEGCREQNYLLFDVLVKQTTRSSPKTETYTVDRTILYDPTEYMITQLLDIIHEHKISTIGDIISRQCIILLCRILIIYVQVIQRWQKNMEYILFKLSIYYQWFILWILILADANLYKNL